MPEKQRLLCGRYELQHCIGPCAETLRYLSCDKKTGASVLVSEFFSESIMMRADDLSVQAKPGCEVQYKSLQSDFEELCRYQMNLPADCPILRPTDVFREEGTVFAVFPMAPMQYLDDYLARREKIGWLDMKKAMGPIVGLVSKMHADGIYHRGISPETILVDDTEKLWLTGLSIPPARTVGSEIASTLYFGYSAPEQYSSSSWQGTWTDVYSLAAVCYRMVTGTTPVEWRQRTPQRPLPKPSSLADMPEYVSDAIVKGLCVELSERWHTPDEFWCNVLAESNGGTIRYPIAEIPKRTDLPPEPSRTDGKLGWIALGVVAASITIFGSMALSSHIADTYLPTPSVSTSEEQSQEEESSILEMTVPDFRGQNIETLLLDPQYQTQFVFEVARVYSEVQRAGSVVEQTPPAGTPYTQGETILLSVSKGTEKIVMPRVIGETIDQARAILAEAEISFEEQVTYSGEEQAGTVVASSIPADTIVYRNSDVVTLTVRVNRPEESTPE